MPLVSLKFDRSCILPFVLVVASNLSKCIFHLHSVYLQVALN